MVGFTPGATVARHPRKPGKDTSIACSAHTRNLKGVYRPIGVLPTATDAPEGILCTTTSRASRSHVYSIPGADMTSLPGVSPSTPRTSR